MARTPIDVYRGLIRTRVSPEISPHINAVVERYSDHEFADLKLSHHLKRFIEIWSKHVAYLNQRDSIDIPDLTAAIDLLDYFTSTSKWWSLSRDDPGLVLRPASRDPRNFLKSLPLINIGQGTSGRVSGAAEKLSSFLKEHKLGSTEARIDLRQHIVSVWLLLSAFVCKSQGRNTTEQADFEIAYDITRVLFFHTPPDDFLALTAVRQIATNPTLSKAAEINFARGFDRKLDSSLAARLERSHGEYLTKIAKLAPNASRNILTNSLRVLAQLQALKLGMSRIEADEYDSVIVGAMSFLDIIDVPSALLHEQSKVAELFKSLQPEEGVEEKMALMRRRIEGLLVDSTGNRDFLLQFAKLIPRITALLLLLAGGTKTQTGERLKDSDVKRGLILLNRLLNE
ncbi:MAG: hypothetical protein ACXADO_01510 [Candidatus Thorarchaeota archaeon]